MTKSNASKKSNRVHAGNVGWSRLPRYPDDLMQVLHWKELIGPSTGAGIRHGEVRIGVIHLDAGATYPAHAHPAPEIYFIIRGKAEWTVGDETFEAIHGMAIYHPPDVSHNMINSDVEPLVSVVFWWAPGGKRGVMDKPSVLLEQDDKGG